MSDGGPQDPQPLRRSRAYAEPEPGYPPGPPRRRAPAAPYPVGAPVPAGRVPAADDSRPARRYPPARGEAGRPDDGPPPSHEPPPGYNQAPADSRHAYAWPAPDAQQAHWAGAAPDTAGRAATGDISAERPVRRAGPAEPADGRGSAGSRVARRRAGGGYPGDAGPPDSRPRRGDVPGGPAPRGRGTPGSLDRRAAAAEPGPPSGLPRRGPEGDGPGLRDRPGGLAAAPRYTPGDGYLPAPASPPGLRPEPGAGRSEPRDGRSAPAGGSPGSPAGRSEPGSGRSAPAGGWPESLGGPQEPPVGRCPGERRAAAMAGTLATRTAAIRIRRPRPRGTAAPWPPGHAARAAGCRAAQRPAGFHRHRPPGPPAVRCAARPAAPQGSGARCRPRGQCRASGGRRTGCGSRGIPSARAQLRDWDRVAAGRQGHGRPGAAQDRGREPDRRVRNRSAAAPDPGRPEADRPEADRPEADGRGRERSGAPGDWGQPVGAARGRPEPSGDYDFGPDSVTAVGPAYRATGPGPAPAGRSSMGVVSAQAAEAFTASRVAGPPRPPVGPAPSRCPAAASWPAR